MMPILCLEGASAVGRTTICRELEKRYGAYIVPEVNLLFERPAEEQKNWYLDRQVERWKMALEQSRNNELVVLDGYIYISRLAITGVFTFKSLDKHYLH